MNREEIRKEIEIIFDFEALECWSLEKVRDEIEPLAVKAFNAGIEKAAKVPHQGTATQGYFSMGPEAISKAIRSLKLSGAENE